MADVSSPSPSQSYRARRRSLWGPHDPLQRRAYTPTPPTPPRQAASARRTAADRAGRPPIVVVFVIAVRLGPELAGGGGGERREGLATIAEPNAEPANLCRCRCWRRDAGGSAAAFDAADATTRRECVKKP